MRDKAPNT